MADLNIRNVTPALIKSLKSRAALLGVSLREYCIESLSSERIEDLKAYLSEQKKPNVTPKPKPSPPPVDTAPSYYVPAKYRDKK